MSTRQKLGQIQEIVTTWMAVNSRNKQNKNNDDITF